MVERIYQSLDIQAFKVKVLSGLHAMISKSPQSVPYNRSLTVFTERIAVRKYFVRYRTGSPACRIFHSTNHVPSYPSNGELED